MIADPTTDIECLNQLTKMARELVRTTLVQDVAHHLRTRVAVVSWLQSLPQSDDDGHDHIRAIECDVWQRVRLFPDDPNCVERSFAALVLLEILEPRTTRMLVTVDRPLRHTGIVEQRAAKWTAIDLFPRRNAIDFGGYGITALEGAHQYVGAPLLKLYLGGETGGKVADAIGGQEKRLADSRKKPAPSKKQPQPATAPKNVVAGAAKPAATVSEKRLAPAIAAAPRTTTGGPRRDETSKEPELPPIAAGFVADGNGEDDEDSTGETTEAERWGWR